MVRFKLRVGVVAMAPWMMMARGGLPQAALLRFGGSSGGTPRLSKATARLSHMDDGTLERTSPSGKVPMYLGTMPLCD